MYSLRLLLKRTFPSVWSTLSALRRGVLNRRSPTSVFDSIYRTNAWGDQESVSGPGSSMEKTEVVRRILPEVLRETDARVLLDVPCGDFHWMKHVDLGEVAYVGGDIVSDLIQVDEQTYGGDGRSFVVLDVIRDALPEADVLLCRDCLIHLPNHMALEVLANVCASPVRYLLTTTCVDVDENIDIGLGGWRPLNLERPPFSLPPPMALYPEGGHEGRSLGLWRVEDLLGTQTRATQPKHPDR